MCAIETERNNRHLCLRPSLWCLRWLVFAWCKQHASLWQYWYNQTDFFLPFLIYLIWSLGATATDSLSAGYRTVLIDDCCRGVDLTDIEATKDGILSNHGVIVQSHEVRWHLSPETCFRCWLFTLTIETASSDKTFVAFALLLSARFNERVMIPF